MRVALTGAATGIGAATASKLRTIGAEVIGFDIAEPSVDVDQWIAVDLSQTASIDDAAAAATGSFDALLNVAGLPPREGLTETILSVNTLGLIAFTRAMSDKLSADAAIVNVASRAGAKWRNNIDQVKAFLALENPDEIPGFVAANGIDPVRAYDLSKEAVIVWSMAQCAPLAKEGKRINTVSPAAVSTAILDDFITAFGDRARKGIALAGRPGTAEEIADVIVFLAGRESRWINGQDITIDGGISAMMQAELLGLAG